MRVSQWILLHTLPTSLSLLLKYRDQAKASEEGESHARVEHRWLGGVMAALGNVAHTLTPRGTPPALDGVCGLGGLQ